MSTFEPTVYVISDNSDPAIGVRYMIFEQTSPGDAHMVLTIRQGRVVRLLHTIGLQAPNIKRIIDVQGDGRRLLKAVLDKDPSTSPDIYLCSQAEHIVPHTHKLGSKTKQSRSYCAELLQKLYMPISAGGPYRISAQDTVVARNYDDISSLKRKDIAKHPVVQVLRKFVCITKRMKGTAAHYDAKHVEQLIMQIALEILAEFPNPFPIDIETSCFSSKLYRNHEKACATGNVSPSEFIYASLRAYPQSPPTPNERIIRCMGKLIKMLDLTHYPITLPGKTCTQYQDVFSFLELVFAIWAVSFYDDRRGIMRLVDWGLLVPDFRRTFQKFALGI